MKNWLDNFEGGNEPSKYSSIPTGIIKPPTIVSTTGISHYAPEEQTIYLNPEDEYYDPSVYQHEMFHHWQNLNDQLRKPNKYEGPLAKPSIVANEDAQMAYYNRRNVETAKEFKKFYKENPTFKLVNPWVNYYKEINPNLYENPKYAEGEAEDYQNYVKGGGTPAFMAKGGLIKRADGSYSRRGLWDNIRANRGSGRTPTAEMLRQERKIKKHAEGSFVDGGEPNLQDLINQYNSIQEQVNKGDINKKAYVENMRKIADDLIAKGFSLEESGILPESVMNNSTNTGYCIGTSCYLADQAGDKFYPQGSSFFTSNSMAQDYARDNPNASRYLEQNEKYLSEGDIVQFKSGEKGRPYHAYTVYSIGQPNEEGDKTITVVGSPGHGQMHKKTYILGKDNKIYSDEYGMKAMMHDTQLLKRREDNQGYNNLLSQRDALKQQILGIDPLYFTPKEDIRTGDYRQTGFELNNQGQGNEYGRYVQTDNGKTKIQVVNPGTVEQAYNARPYADATNSGLTDILTKYSDPQYKYDYMQKHNISSTEYDALVSNMVGIYGAESKFGTDYTAKGKLPEWPWLSKLANATGIIDEENRSIGPFQITYNQLPEAYRKTIKSKDLYDPNIAADATMEYLTAGLPLLRKRANTTAETATDNNPYSSNITKDNYLEYVPYLYNMRGWLKGDKATLENKGDILRGDAGYKQLVDQYRNNVLQIMPSSLTTPQPLEVTPQQKYGGYVQKPCCDGNMYKNGSTVKDTKPPKKTLKQALLDYKESADENKFELFDPTGITSWDDAAKGYDSWQKSGRTYPTLTESLDMFSAVPILGKAKKVEMGIKEIANAPKWALDWWKAYQAADYLRDEYNDKIKKKDNGSWVADSSIPVPTSPSYYPAGADRTLSNYQMGTPKARMYGSGSKVTPSSNLIWYPEIQAYGLPEIPIYGNKKSNIDSSNVRESTFVNTPRFTDKIVDVNKMYDESGDWLNPDYQVAYANKLLKDYDVSVDSTGNILDDIGLNSAAYYNPASRTIHYDSKAKNSDAAKRKYAHKVFQEIPHAIQADRMGTVPFLVNIGLDGLSYLDARARYETEGTLENEAHHKIVPLLEKQFDKQREVDYIRRTPSLVNIKDVVDKKANGGPVMYNAGSTVWTNQDTPLWAAGTPTPTSTQHFKNDRSINTDRYRVGDVVPIPNILHAFDPSAGTHDYNQDVQPYHTMRLHAPDTTRMGDGGPTNPIGGLWDTNRKAFVDSTLQANTDKEWVRRLYNSNAGSIKLPGEKYPSTHLMSDDGTRVYPQIQNINGKLTYLPGDQGWDYADNTKSYINFNYPEQAAWFAANGYKIGTNVLNNINSKGTPVNNPNYVTPKHKHGSYVKKHINSPRVYGNPVNPSGMTQGPSMQRGVMFGNGSTVGVDPAYEAAKQAYIKASSIGIMGENQMQSLVKQYPQLANDSSLAGTRSVGNAALNRANAEHNRIETNTLGQVLSTPASREKAYRQQVIARRPEVYHVQDYIKGIQEPGAPNDITNDPLAMAIIGTATGGIGLGAEGLGARSLGTMATDFAGNLASEATFGATDLAKGSLRLGNNFTKNIVKEFNPSNLIIENTPKGEAEKWIDNWYNNHYEDILTRRNNYTPGNKFKNPWNNKLAQLQNAQSNLVLGLYQPKNYTDLLKDKGIKEYLSILPRFTGVSYGNPNEIYVNNLVKPLFGKKAFEAVKAHELTHLVHNNGKVFNEVEKNALLEPFGYTNEQIFKQDKTPVELLGKRKGYYLEPAEIHARMNEARFNLGLTPKDEFTLEMFDKIQKENNWSGMGKYIKDKKGFVNLMNNFWVAAPGVIAAGMYNAPTAQEEQKQANGGYVKNSSSNNWLDTYN